MECTSPYQFYQVACMPTIPPCPGAVLGGESAGQPPISSGMAIASFAYKALLVACCMVVSVAQCAVCLHGRAARPACLESWRSARQVAKQVDLAQKEAEEGQLHLLLSGGGGIAHGALRDEKTLESLTKLRRQLDRRRASSKSLFRLERW